MKCNVYAIMKYDVHSLTLKYKCVLPNSHGDITQCNNTLPSTCHYLTTCSAAKQGYIDITGMEWCKEIK